VEEGGRCRMSRLTFLPSVKNRLLKQPKCQIGFKVIYDNGEIYLT
jgi:hypothetical protein